MYGEEEHAKTMDAKAWLIDYVALYMRVCNSPHEDVNSQLEAYKDYIYMLSAPQLAELLFRHSYGDPVRRAAYLEKLSSVQLYPDRRYERYSADELVALAEDLLCEGARLEVAGDNVSFFSVPVMFHSVKQWHWECNLILSALCRDHMHEFENTTKRGYASKSHLHLKDFSCNFVFMKGMRTSDMLRDIVLMQLARQGGETEQNAFCRNCILPAATRLLVKNPNNEFVLHLLKICYDTNVGHGRSKSSQRIIEGLQTLRCDQYELQIAERAKIGEAKFRRKLALKNAHKRTPFPEFESSKSSKSSPTPYIPVRAYRDRFRAKVHVNDFQ